MVNCRRKAGLDWDETASFLAGVRALCSVEDVTLRTHEVGRTLAERYGFSVYDAMIVAVALIAGCTTLWTEDMHRGCWSMDSCAWLIRSVDRFLGQYPQLLGLCQQHLDRRGLPRCPPAWGALAHRLQAIADGLEGDLGVSPLYRSHDRR